MKGIKIKIHWSFILLGILMIVFGNFVAFFCTIITVVLHELGHSIVGRKLGYKLDLITILPYGAMLSGKNTPFSNKDEILIALAGPFVNAILVLGNIIFWLLFPNTFNISNYFFSANLCTLFFNLLPVYPLDGGRVMVAILSTKMSRIKAQNFTKIFGYITTIVMFLMFFVSFFQDLNYMLGINAIFLLIGLFEEDTSPYYQKIKNFETLSFLGSQKKVAKLEKTQPIYVAYKMIANNNAKLIKICDKGKVIKTISKNNILSSILRFPIDTKLEKLC